MAIGLCAAAGSLSACGVNVHSSAVRGVGYVRIDEAVKRDPLYSQLSQLDDAMAAITLKSSAPAVPLGARQIAAQTAELNRECAPHKIARTRSWPKSNVLTRRANSRRSLPR